ncbi:MAG: hypothetical protein KC621_00650 [Myxococcales bacterium]|nr:hypothetical protein [Myxococcales bacterium]
MWRVIPVLLATACTSATQERIERTILLTVENRSGAQLWYFQYSGCGIDDWFEVIASDEYVPDGADVSSVDLDPGCYELYVEDEYGCWSENDTDGNVKGGFEFTWTVRASDMTCPLY